MPLSHKAQDQGVKEIHFGRNFVDIPHLQFFGITSKSPNNLFTIAWGGKDHASYVLLKKEKILVQGKVELRAADGRVADNGNFIIIDILGDTLECVFYVFDMMGKQLISKKFNANSRRTALSKDGNHAVCHLANNPKHPDGGTVAVFDLVYRALLCQQKPYSDWDKGYGFCW